MKRVVMIVLAVMLISYEISYRAITSSCGEVKVEDGSLTIYYATPYYVANDLLYVLFYPRVCLPIGMVRLSAGSGLYVRGGQFYKADEDGLLYLLSGAEDHRDQSLNDQ